MRVAADGLVALGTAERGQRTQPSADAVRMQPRRNLLIAQQHVRRTASRQRLRATAVADVIDAFEQDHLIGIGHGDHIAIQSRQRTVAAAMVKQFVAADALVEYHEPVRAGLLQALRQSLRPLVEGAATCGGAFRDGIAQRHDYLGTIITLHHHCREHVLLVAQPHAVGDGCLPAICDPQLGAAHGGQVGCGK